MSDAETLWAAVRAAPTDATPKLVLADYLEESGGEATGYALRWCVAHDRWPHHVGDGPRGWAWGRGVAGNVPPPRGKGHKRAVLPSIFFEVFSRNAYYTRASSLPTSWRFGSEVEAIERLGLVLARIRALVGLVPDAGPGAAPDGGRKAGRRR